MGFKLFSTGSQDCYNMHTMEVAGAQQFRNVPGQWRVWQHSMLKAFAQLYRMLSAAGLTAPSAMAAAEAAAAAPAAAAAAPAVESNGTRRIKWGYLLHLQQHSSWCEATAVFTSSWPDVMADIERLDTEFVFKEDSTETSSSSSGGTANVEAGSTDTRSSQQPVDGDKLHADALQLCRAVVAAAPLPLVCNNLRCGNLAGSSETKAAVKMCAGCRCRYCSAACQEADWRHHRSACKAMVAAGMTCK
jgi:hypothetical protein